MILERRVAGLRAKDFSKGPDFPELADRYPDLSADPNVVKALKAGDVVRLPVGRIVDKLLEILLTPDGAGSYEVSTEWSVFSANSSRADGAFPTIAGGSRWSQRIP